MPGTLPDSITGPLTFLIILAFAVFACWRCWVKNPPSSMVDHYRFIFSEGQRFLVELKEMKSSLEDIAAWPGVVQEQLIAQMGFDIHVIDEFIQLALVRPEFAQVTPKIHESWWKDVNHEYRATRRVRRMSRDMARHSH